MNSASYAQVTADGIAIVRNAVLYLMGNNMSLPVQLLTFSGSRNSNGIVHLVWQAANQRNFKYFEVERSNDGTSFVKAGQVNAVTNTSVQDYQFADATKANATVFYRLKMVDADGRFSYSNTVRILPVQTGSFVQLLQNPVSDHISLLVANAERQHLTATLYSSTGQLVTQWNPGTQDGNLILPLTAPLSNGLYNLRVTAGNKTTILKVVKH